MLKKPTSKSYFLLAYFLVCTTQLFAALNNQLFGDEAFYWLEGQYLAWSYSEIPGWTPWTLALMDVLFPQHHFFVRLPTLMAAMSIPWLGIAISNRITANQSNKWLAGLLLLALPILGVAGTLAIADVWIVFFSILAFWYLTQAIQTQQNIQFILLGLVLALGINVHLRIWLVILITCVVVMWLFRKNAPTILKLLKLTLPLMLLGFVPILLFNLQHDFPLLSFQLKDRHPWEFQASHFSFFLIQIIITTPWVFYLCLKSIKQTGQSSGIENKQALLIKTITFAAIIHWLIYAMVGFFSDTLRLNVHWTLISYVLLLITSTTNTSATSRLKNWAMVTGITANLWLLMTISYWLHHQSPQSTVNARITGHATGWQQLAEFTDDLLVRENSQAVVADHFMTLAQLEFYSRKINNIKVLSHPLNVKHGRAKQLEVMELLADQSNQPQILVVEHSALKLTELVGFYQSACQQLHGIKLIDSLDIGHGLKRYHFFKTGQQNNRCDIPPIVYYETNNQILNGWIIHNKTQALSVSLYDAVQQTNLAYDLKVSSEPLGSNPIFNELNNNEYQLLKFSMNKALPEIKTSVQLKLELSEHIILSQRLLLNP